MGRRLGSFCTGYGGLDLGVGQVLDVEHAWHSELDPDASKVLAARFPSVPNIGDLREVDWAAVEPVDVLTAGFPCQPVSAAGRRKGINDERWLWDDIQTAVGRMDPRPRVLVLENVAGLLSANHGHALARVVNGLASLGYVGRYRLLRASDVGAAHRRERWFCLAQLAADADRARRREDSGGAPGDEGADAGRPALADHLASGAGPVGLPAAGLSLLPTPNAALGRGTGFPSERTAQERFDRGTRCLDDAIALLPTPTVIDARGGRNATAARSATASENWSPGWTLSDVAFAARWGNYADAIARWETIIGRPSPEPTEPGTKGQPRLASRFVEWLMGLPDGWVTDHLPRNPALRVLGNGVVPAQVAAALNLLAVDRG